MCINIIIINFFLAAILGNVHFTYAQNGSENRILPNALMIDDDGISTPLTKQAGNAQRGEQTFGQREMGHCVLCHKIDGLDVAFQGNVGPDLSQIGMRLNPAQIRLRIVDPTRIWPETVMPSYYRIDGLNQVATAYQGQTILAAQDIEDIIAYLTTSNGAE